MAGLLSRDDHWRSFFDHGWLLATALLFSFFVAVLSLTTPLFMLLVYDRVLSSGSVETLTALLILASVLIVGMSILDYARQRVLARFAGRFQADLEFSLLRLPDRRQMPGSSNATRLEALDRLRAFIHSGALLTVIDVIWLPLYLAAVFLMSPMIGSLALIGLIIASAIFAIGKFLGARSATHAERDQRKASNTMTKVKDASSWLPGFGVAHAFQDWLLRLRATSRVSAIWASDFAAATTVTLNMIRSLLTIVVLSAGAGLVMHNQLTVGGMVASVVLLNRVFAPFLTFLKGLPTVTTAVRHWREIGKLLSEPANNVRSKDVSSLFSGPLLELRSLCLSSPTTSQVLLQDVNLRISQGEIVEIIGAPNSGKTILAETIVSARAPDRGIVMAQGRQLTSLTTPELSKVIGFVPETPQFLPGSTLRAITGPSRELNSSRAESAAAMTGLHSRLATFHQGYDTVIDSLGAPLARSDRHLLALTRALFNDPRIIVIDEPSSQVLSHFAGAKREVVDSFLSSGGSLLLIGSATTKLPWPTRHLEIRNRRLVTSPQTPIADTTESLKHPMNEANS